MVRVVFLGLSWEEAFRKTFSNIVPENFGGKNLISHLYLTFGVWEMGQVTRMVFGDLLNHVD